MCLCLCLRIFDIGCSELQKERREALNRKRVYVCVLTTTWVFSQRACSVCVCVCVFVCILRRSFSRGTLPATREFKTQNLTVSWKLGVRRIRIRIGRRSYKFRIVVLPAEYVTLAKKKRACGSLEELTKFDI